MNLRDTLNKICESAGEQKLKRDKLEFDRVVREAREAAKIGRHHVTLVISSEVTEMLKESGLLVQLSNQPGEEYHSIISW
jgi:hypothetical protein